jgi:hypothetical protein
MTPAVEVPSDRRIAPRVQPAFDTVCRFATEPGSDPKIGLVWNISETGVSMLLTEPMPLDAQVECELAGEKGGPGLPITIQVVHVVPMPSGDYFLGARFAERLTDEQLRQFVLT